MPKETRLSLSDDDLRHMLYGGTLVQGGTHIILQDIGLTYVREMAIGIQAELEDHPTRARFGQEKEVNSAWED